MSNAHSSTVSIDRVAHQIASNHPRRCTDGYSVDKSAERLSGNCFFNALLRETGCGDWHERSEVSLPDGIRAPAVRIPLPESATELWVNVAYRSGCGRHQFALPVVWRRGDGACSVIDLARTADVVASEPSFFPGASRASRVQFVQRVTASVENMARALRARKADTERLFTHPLTFSEAEQGLLCGHSIHPTPKSRDPFTDRDAERFAPEFGNSFFLLWLGVDPKFLCGASGAEFSERQFAALVRERDRGPRVPRKWIPVPAHPWQWQRLRREPRVAGLLENGNIVELGSGLVPWRATSSLRAVYSTQSPYMLKFSLSLRLTNSIRTLQPKEMARGLEVLKVRDTPVGREFSNRYPHFQVLAEPAYLMLKDGGGAPIIESLVMFRENPFRGQNASNTCLLATLTQDHPGGAPCRAARLIFQLAEQEKMSAAVASRRWFTAFLDTVIEPLLIAQADFGILFGAHQQNLILSFEGNLPVAGYFRDCQGSGYSQLGEKLLKPHLPDLARKSGNVIDEQMANRLFVYYLIINSCFGLISALAAAGLLTERELLGQLRNRLQLLHDGQRRDRSCLDYLLRAPVLWSKGNFQCAVIGMNETTSDDPLSIYHTMENPLIHITRRDSAQG
ncbi:IucA/IucC family siderophore biosynthesis protein [Microbulbifer sp. 2205BS26-8]|uniref:IucA/IucC family protein n=1 Tax=Microbulbifer sp. 2205BS26-8 TaxID=3064386 RepID=UPI00273EA709|nr:IucA/IucC family protein [Microbulbifer sp. 2205BS26-8]MDP5210183.1 IucA/IucC family protein [Microbulbifer sp. 2205BS26-8]